MRRARGYHVPASGQLACLARDGARGGARTHAQMPGMCHKDDDRNHEAQGRLGQGSRRKDGTREAQRGAGMRGRAWECRDVIGIDRVR